MKDYEDSNYLLNVMGEATEIGLGGNLLVRQAVGLSPWLRVILSCIHTGRGAMRQRLKRMLHLNRIACAVKRSLLKVAFLFD